MNRILKIGMQYFAEQENTKPEDVGGGAPPAEEPAPPADGLPKTQEELDALIERRLARERKKAAKPPAEQGFPARESAVPNAELETANRELLTARVQLEAYRSGIKADAVEDAAYLALREAEKAGEADEDGVKDALKNVLKRHPEWKQSEKQSGGIKFGAGGEGKPPDSKEIAEIFGNTN